MKKLLLTTLILHACYCLMAQKKETKSTIAYKEFDYLQDTSIVYIDRVKINSRLGIRVKNVNKKLVDINSQVTKTDFNSEMPKIFEMFTKVEAPAATESGSGFSQEDFILFETDELSPLSSALREKLQLLQKNYDELGYEIILRENLLNALGERFRHIKYVVEYGNQLEDMRNSCNLPFDTVLSDVVALTKRSFTAEKMSLNADDKALLLSGSNYRQDKGIIRSYMSTELDEANMLITEVNRQFAPTKMEYLANLLKSVKTGLKGIEVELEKSKKGKDKDFAAMVKKTQLEIKGGKELLDLNARFASIDISKIESCIEAFEAVGKKELLALYDQFNESNYTYYVTPAAIDKDLNIITVDIKPKEEVNCAPLARFYELRIRPKKGLKIDFSSGFFMNFGGNNFLDQSYRYDSVAGEPDKSVIAQNEGKNSIFPSVGALMHIYERNGRDCHFAGTFGVSTKDLDKINFHVGGSAIFGYKERFILSAGATMTKAMLISDKNYVGQVIDKATAPADVATSDFHRFGFFVAFTFNLTASK